MKLKPCPFCGRRGVIKEIGEYGYYPSCTSRKCMMYFGAHDVFYKTRVEAENDWNKRAEVKK